MEIKLTENIKIEMNLPIKKVESFQYSWKPDCHAQLQLIGYIDVTIPWNPILCYDSYVKLQESDKKIEYPVIRDECL